MSWLLSFLDRIARFVATDDARPARPVESAVAGSPPPSPRLAEAGAPRCPEHGALLELTPLDGVRRCPVCGGCLVEAGLDRAVLEDPGRFTGFPLDDAPVERERPRYRACPSCGEHMARANLGRVSGIIVDRCPRHGTWFDPGELRAALVFAAGDGLDRKAAFETREEEWQAEQKKVIERWRQEGMARVRSGRIGGLGDLGDIDLDLE